MTQWNWSDSFIMKDALSIARKAHKGEDFISSYQPQLLKRLCEVMLDCPERPKDNEFRVLEPARMYDSICLTSGGADSTIFWHYAGKPQGLYIDIGQSYAVKEMNALKRSEISFEYLDLRGTRIGQLTWKHIIPARNFIFLCAAAEMIKDCGTIWFAMVEGEGAESDRGDKSLMFVSLFQDWYLESTGRHVYVQTAHEKTKAGWLQFAKKMQFLDDIRINTVTCFDAKQWQCGKCQACLRKYLSYVSLGMDTSNDYVIHPMAGAREFITKYRKNLGEAFSNQDFSHYSEKRCSEDLAALVVAENWYEAQTVRPR